MKIFVTGANGFLGQHLIKLLLDNNYSVIATGRGLASFNNGHHSI